MLLKQLLKNLDYTLVQGCLNTEVTDIYYDSRKVTPGGLFVCIVGTQRDSHDYAADVAAKGAAVLAIQHDLPAEVLAALPDVTVVKFENTRYAMALLSTAYFGRPALEMTMVGVTGTKGKTTTTHMIKAVLEAAGHKVGMVGTNGVYYPGHHYDLNNTTPESYELQKILRQLADAGCDACVMEVSSQGIMMDRVAGIHYKVGVFTNLYPDHIGPGEHAVDHPAHRLRRVGHVDVRIDGIGRPGACDAGTDGRAFAAVGNVDDLDVRNGLPESRPLLVPEIARRAVVDDDQMQPFVRIARAELRE